MAVEIFNRLQDGRPRVVDSKLRVEELIDAYFEASKAKGLARKTEWKYSTDLDKLKEFWRQGRISLAHTFSREALFAYRQWLDERGCADKTIYGALTLAKQVFKWGFQEGRLREYRLGSAKIAKAKARPQPCFTTEQAELIVANSEGPEKAAFATLAYAGLRIGELEQLQWADRQFSRGDLGMFHIRRGGSNGTTKDKDHRFVPVHPRIRPLLQALPKTDERVFPDITERRLLRRLKEVCGEIGLRNPKRFKLHSFRHHFASLCANHSIAYRKALTWLGHSKSEMLDLYYHLHDADSQAAMKSLADDAVNVKASTGAADSSAESAEGGFEGNGAVNNRESTPSSRGQGACGVLRNWNGEGGIRTRGTRKGTRHFQCRPIGHSGTSPGPTARHYTQSAFGFKTVQPAAPAPFAPSRAAADSRRRLPAGP